MNEPSDGSCLQASRISLEPQTSQGRDKLSHYALSIFMIHKICDHNKNDTHSCVVAQLCSTLCDWTVARQVPLSMGFSKKNTGVVCHLPPPGDCPHAGIEPRSPVSPALQADDIMLTIPTAEIRNWGVQSALDSSVKYRCARGWAMQWSVISVMPLGV